MRAKVIKTGEIVTLTDKHGDYYIDTNDNPYREEELEFGITQDLPTETDPMQMLNKMMGNLNDHSHMMFSPAMLFATDVARAHPELDAAELGDYVATVINLIKKAL